MPRDIDSDIDQLENVYLYNVDHLEELVRENVRLRERELAGCRAILAERATALMPRLETANRNPAAASLPPQPGWLLGAQAA